MLSLLVISAITGLCLAQQASEFSECPKLNEITTKTCEHHLTYLKALHSNSYNYFMEISQMKDPITLVQTVNIEKACNESELLSSYYRCVYREVKSCLVNSSQSLGVPSPDKMAYAILSICHNQNVINGTCYNSRTAAATDCNKKTMIQKMAGAIGIPEAGANLDAADEPLADNEEEGPDDAEEVKVEPASAQSQSQDNQLLYHTHTPEEEKQREIVCGMFEINLECLDKTMDDCLGYEKIVREMFIASTPEECGDHSSSAASGTLAATLLLLLPVLCRWLLV